MPRIRSIKPELATSRKLAQASREARYTFVLLITQADDEGFVYAEPRQLLGALYPHDADVTPGLLETWLADLVACGSVHLRETKDGARVAEIVGWREHQFVKNPGKPKISPTLLPFYGGSTEGLRRVGVDSTPFGVAEVVVVGGSEGVVVGDAEDGSAAASSTAVNNVNNGQRHRPQPDIAPPPPHPDRGLLEHFPDASHQDAYLAYRESHRHPTTFDASVRNVHAPIAGGPSYPWEVIGEALRDMAASQVVFTPRALTGFCRKVGAAAHGDREGQRAEIRARIDADIAAGKRGEMY